MKHNVKALTLLMIVSIFIVGCNGSNSESSDIHPTPPKKEISIYTQDTIQFSDGKRPIIVDLRNRVKSENNEDTIISDVKSLNPDNENCSITDINGLTFTTLTNDIGICRYEYKVKPINSSSVGQGRAISQVIVTEDYEKGEYLPPISSVLSPSTETEPSSIIFDKSQIQIPDGFIVDNVNLIGDTESHELGSISFDDKSITYLAPVDTTGVVRIYYSIVNEDSGIIRPGIIYIAIGQSINSNPVAEPESRIASISILDDERSPINVDPYTNDPDKDPLQLVYVYSSQGVVKDINGLEFTYIPTETGTNYITYIVSDHNGGYAVGLLISEVSSFINIYDDNQNVTFSAPLTQSDLAATEGISSGQNMESGDSGPKGIYPLFNRDLAISYCTTRGLVLPTKKQYTSLFTDKLKSTPIYDSEYEWIAGAPYVAIDGFVSLATGDVDETVELGYFSCVEYVAGPEEYSFSQPAYLGEFDKNVVITAAANSSYGLFPLPEELYDLKTEVFRTMPEGLEDKVSIFVSGQTVRVSVEPSIEDEIKNVIVSVKDPVHVQGEISDTKIIYGISECPLGATTEEILDSDCIPTIGYIGSPTKVTGPVSSNTMANMGIDITKIPSVFKKITDSPEYVATAIADGVEESYKMYDEWNNKGRSFVANYCDILSSLYIGGRDNWVAKFPGDYHPESKPGWHSSGFVYELDSLPKKSEQFSSLESAINAMWTDKGTYDVFRIAIPFPVDNYNIQTGVTSRLTYSLFHEESVWVTQIINCVSLQ
ncbi:Ig-like domain-containing protein [Photobacterium damselae]